MDRLQDRHSHVICQNYFGVVYGLIDNAIN